MSEEILINVTPRETRLALIENGLLQEIYLERRSRSGYVGDIYLGKVVRVMPGMEAAFIDIGLDRAAFLHSADIAQIGADGLEVRDGESVDINTLLREGQLIVVQVAKDPIGTKGARLTTHLTLPSRHLVFLPRNLHIGISQRLENEQERNRLQALLEQCLTVESMQDRGGFIIRTAAEGAAENELLEDIRFLRKLWAAVERRIGKSKDIRVLYRDLPLYLRAVRDLIRLVSRKSVLIPRKPLTRLRALFRILFRIFAIDSSCTLANGRSLTSMEFMTRLIRHWDAR